MAEMKIGRKPNVIHDNAEPDSPFFDTCISPSLAESRRDFYVDTIFPLRAKDACSAPLIRVCQPSPLARSAATTSAYNRI